MGPDPKCLWCGEAEALHRGHPGGPHAGRGVGQDVILVSENNPGLPDYPLLWNTARSPRAYIQYLEICVTEPKCLFIANTPS
jgi:hypothetical protein